MRQIQGFSAGGRAALLDEAQGKGAGRGASAAKSRILATCCWQCSNHRPRAARRFLAGKNITELAVRRQLAEGRSGPAQHLDRQRWLGPAPHHGLCSHWGAERPPAASRTGTPALRHAGRYRLRCRGGAAGVHGVQLAEAVRECRQLSGSSSCPAPALGHAPRQPRQRLP